MIGAPAGSRSTPRERSEREVDAGPFATGRGRASANSDTNANSAEFKYAAAQQVEQHRGARIPVRMQRMSEAADRLASPQQPRVERA